MKKTLIPTSISLQPPHRGTQPGLYEKLKQKWKTLSASAKSTDIAEDQAQADDNHDGTANGNKPIQRPTPSGQTAETPHRHRHMGRSSHPQQSLLHRSPAEGTSPPHQSMKWRTPMPRPRNLLPEDSSR